MERTKVRMVRSLCAQLEVTLQSIAALREAKEREYRGLSLVRKLTKQGDDLTDLIYELEAAHYWMSESRKALLTYAEAEAE